MTPTRGSTFSLVVVGGHTFIVIVAGERVGLNGFGAGILVSWTPSGDGYVTSTIVQYSGDGGLTWYLSI